jgi:tetratricopeptide (TPR) repeat protein
MRFAATVAFAAVLALGLMTRSVFGGAPAMEIPKAPNGFFQSGTPAFIIECNVSKAYCDKVTMMVGKAEQQFYRLFKLTPELMNGTSKVKFDVKNNIPGDVMSLFGFTPFIEVRVYKDMESFSDEWFEHTGVKDKQKRLTQGVPGAWFSIHPNYDKTKMVRDIRSFVANRDDDELERTLLHEMGHLFMHSYLLAFGGGQPPPGQESQKRGVPAWLSEGLAQWFENGWSKVASAQKAKQRQEAMIYEATQLGDSYPFDEFVNITNAHNLAAVAGNPLRATLNYAQSFSVMDYMINVDGARFFAFLENLRAANFENNLRAKDKNHVHELFSFQNDCFKRAFNCELADVEKYWKASVKKNMELQLKKQPELYYWVGEYYLRRGKDKEADLAKAEEKFKTAMTQAPKSGLGYLGMGRMQLRKHDNDTAVTTLTKATELLPKDDEPWYYLGMAQLSTGKTKEAVESLNKSLKIFPRSHRTVSGLATAYFHNSQYPKAMEAYEEAYQISHNPYYEFQKGQAAFFGKQYREAQTAFAVFTDAFPQDPQGMLWYGLAAWRLNDRPFAMEKMQAALKLNPNDPQIKGALEMAQKGETMKFEREQLDEATAAGKPAEKKPLVIQVEDE